MLTLAHSTALESQCKQRVGAVVVRGGSILSKATNRDYNHPEVLEDEKILYHAAICAERRALAMISPEAARGATVFVVRAARRDDGFACSKPCARCEKTMKELGVKRCVYVD